MIARNAGSDSAPPIVAGTPLVARWDVGEAVNEPSELGEFSYVTTPDGGLTYFDEEGATVWDEERFDPEYDIESES